MPPNQIFQKNRVIRTILTPNATRVQFYQADADASPPFHARAIVTCEAKDANGVAEPVNQDVRLSDFLSNGERTQTVNLLAQVVAAALQQAGFSVVPE